MKRTLRKVIGFILCLSLAVQIIATVDANVYQIHASMRGVISQGTASGNHYTNNGFVYDYSDYDYDDYEDEDYNDWYSVDSDGKLTWIDEVPEDGKLPEGIKEIDTTDKWALNEANKLIFPEGLEKLTLTGEVREVSLPYSLKEFYLGYCKNLEKITIPDGVEKLTIDFAPSDMWTYFEEPAIAEITIPSSVKDVRIEYIGNAVIKGNDKYKTTTDENGCVYIGDTFYSAPDDIKSVTIKDGTVGIAKYALSGCAYVTKVDIPDSVKTIGRQAFAGTSELQSLTLPANLEEIGIIQFYGSGVKELEIPKGVTEIDEYTFWRAGSLQKVTLKGKVTVIGVKAFFEAANLQSINIPDSVKIIEDCAFADAFHSGYTNDWGVYGNNTAKCEITIPGSVETIGYGAFSGANLLKTIKIKNGVKKIENSAFSGCGFDKLKLPASVTEIGEYCFADTNGNVSVASSNKYYTMYKNGLYTKSHSKLICYPKDKTKIKIHKDCKELARGVFANSKLTKVTLPAGLKSLEAGAFTGSENLKSVTIGKNLESFSTDAFSYCTALKKISIKGKNPNFATYKGCLYNKDKTHIIYYPEGMKKVKVNKKTTTFDYVPISYRYFEVEITVPKNVESFDGFYSSQKTGITFKVNAGSKSAEGLAARNGELRYSLIENSSKLIKMIKQDKTSVEVKVGEAVRPPISLPIGLVIADDFDETNSRCIVSWKSSDDSIADADSGYIVGKKAGKATLTGTVKLKDGTYKELKFSVTVTKKKYEKGDVVALGSYAQDNIAENGQETLFWTVLDTSGGNALLLSNKLLDARPFDDDGNRVTWKNSSLRTWLNETFYNNAFSSDEQKHIMATSINNDKYVDNNDGIPNMSSGKSTKDKVFIPSVTDMVNSNYGFFERMDYYSESNYDGHHYDYEDIQRRCTYTKQVSERSTFYYDTYSNNKTTDGEYAYPWWLRTTDESENKPLYVNSSGSIYREWSSSITYGIRPSIYIKNE